MKYLDLSALPQNKIYKWMTSIIVPRPIAWVLTDNDNGSKNLAPFSFFNGICSDPPIVMISLYPKETGDNKPQLKDTLVNIMRTKEATIHIASFGQLSDVNRSSYDIPYGQSELDDLGLTVTDTTKVKCGRITQAPVAMEAVYHSHMEVGDGPTTLLLLELVGIYVSDNWENSADITELDPLMRLGAGEYGRVDMASITGRNRIIKPKK